MAVSNSIQDVHPALATSPLAFRLTGLAFATVLPALFWIALAAEFAHVTNTHVAALALLMAGTAIASFLAAVCAPIILKI